MLYLLSKKTEEGLEPYFMAKTQKEAFDKGYNDLFLTANDYEKNYNYYFQVVCFDENGYPIDFREYYYSDYFEKIVTTTWKQKIYS